MKGKRKKEKRKEEKVRRKESIRKFKGRKEKEGRKEKRAREKEIDRCLFQTCYVDHFKVDTTSHTPVHLIVRLNLASHPQPPQPHYTTGHHTQSWLSCQIERSMARRDVRPHCVNSLTPLSRSISRSVQFVISRQKRGSSR